ncbi:MAG: TonB-dependent receptor plug domain-containing protein [Opitutaceae bacterium]
MNRLSVLLRSIGVASTLGLLWLPRLGAQAAAPARPVVASTAPEETVEMSPFIVQAEEDSGYAAKYTLAGTRIRTELKDVASSISVVTKQFLQDTGGVNNESLLQYTTNTEVGGIWGNYSGVGGGYQYNENQNLLRPNNNTRVRGLDSADNTRDYFLTEIPWDGFNVDRVDLQRGPNSILFGVGSPAGIINTSVNTAGFQNRYAVENRFAEFGSLRFSADFNHVLLPNQLAIRLALLDDNTKHKQEPAYNHDKRIFGAVRYAPKLFQRGNTLVRVNYESGEVKANRPRLIPPVDAVTPWFTTGALGLNKATFNPATMSKGNAPFSNVAWLRNGAVGRQFWADVVGIYGNNNDSTPTDYRQPVPQGNRGIGPNGQVDGGIGGLQVNYPFSIASYSSYALGAINGGSFYSDRSLADTSVFDFFNNLIDGDNKSEWQDWNAGNVAVSQTFFNDRLAFEIVYDYQRYKDGQRVFLGNSDTYKLGIDINSHYADGTPNPNVGRAYVANSDEQANSRNTINRDSKRFTATGELRFDDFMAKESMFTRILGRHNFTGLVSQDVKKTEGRNWATSAATPAYTQSFGAISDSLTAHFRSYDYIAYLSPSLAGMSSASGANIGRVNTLIKAPRQASVLFFDPTWNRPTTPGATGYVDPSAAYTFNPSNFGLTGGPTAPTASTQSENPANYVGWRRQNVTFFNADNGDIDALTYNAQKQRNKIKSTALTWQGHMFDNAIVPVFGWREDKVTNSAASGAVDRLGIASTNFTIPDSSIRTTKGESTSYGVVARLPASWASKLPYKSNISAFYNRSENFKADAPRGDVFGNVIPNPEGKTKEWGVMLNALDDRISLRVTRYETAVANATLNGAGLGQNGYFLWAVPAWGTAFITNADQGIKGNNDNNSWAWNYAASDDPNAPAFRNADGSLNQAWQNHPATVALKNTINAWRQIPLEQSFFNAYGNEVALLNVTGIRAGNWTQADPIWNQKFDNQPISGGLLAGFGSGPVMSVDTISKGTEIELYAQPTKNWNVAVNASKTFASRVSLAPGIDSYIQAMTAFLAGPAGDLRLWGGGASNAMRVQWQNNILNPYNTFLAQRGTQAPEIAEWRFNTVSSYNFTTGRLKGVGIGGAYRYESPKILGYGIKLVRPGEYATDVSAPLKGKSDDHFDLWASYSRKFSDKVKWRIQLNLRNAFEDTRLVPVTINPDNTVGFSRIQQGMTWTVTNAFEF